MNGPIARSPGPADYGLLLLLGALWGASFLLVKIGVGSVPPLTVTAARLVLASLLLLVLARMTGQSLPKDPRTLLLVAFTGVLGNALPFSLISWGQVKIESGLSAILMAVMPLVTYLLAHIFTHDEKLNRFKALGVALGMAGIVVLIGPAKLASLGQETVRQLAVTGAAVCYGFNALLARRLAGHPPLALVAGFMLASAVVLVPLSLVVDQPWTLTPTTEAIAAITVLGLLQTAMGTVLMMVILRRQGASFFSQINFLVPIFGVFWGFLVLAERPSVDALVALGMILAGIALARQGGNMGR
jgi:drug/metabolite transporter (DMT)-like permease